MGYRFRLREDMRNGYYWVARAYYSLATGVEILLLNLLLLRNLLQVAPVSNGGFHLRNCVLGPSRFEGSDVRGIRAILHKVRTSAAIAAENGVEAAAGATSCVNLHRDTRV